MAKYPYYRWFPGDFAAKTQHLSTFEKGVYRQLLDCAWNTKDCMLPNDDDLLARFAGIRKDQWMKMRDIILPFWEVDGPNIKNLRLMSEHMACSMLKYRGSKGGVASAAAKALKTNEPPSTQVEIRCNKKPTQVQQEANQPYPYSTSLSKKPEIGRDEVCETGHEVAQQDDVVDEVWQIVKPWLARFYGDARSGGMTGRLLKHGNPRQVLDAMNAAEECKSQDPYPYMIQALTNQQDCQQLDSGQWRITHDSRQGKAWKSHAKRCRDEKVLGMFTYGDGFITVSKEWPGQN